MATKQEPASGIKHHGQEDGRDRGVSPALDVGSIAPTLGNALAAILGDPGGRRGEGPRRAAVDLLPSPEGGVFSGSEAKSANGLRSGGTS